VPPVTTHRKSVTAASLALLATLLVLTPGSTGAEREARFNVRFTLPASNGYVMRFTAHTGSRRAAVAFEKGGARVTYRVTAATVTTRRVRADFGPFGTVRLRFRPHGKTDIGSCRPIHHGTFRGMVDLQGDDGFTEAHAERASGVVKRAGIGPCFPRPATARDSMDQASKLVFLFACDSSGTDAYVAIGGLYGRRIAHIAETRERIGSVDVTRWRARLGKHSTLAYTRDMRRATVRPPRPFAGHAELRGGRLTGGLEAPLPGLPAAVRLTPADASMRNDPKSCDPFTGRSGRRPALRPLAVLDRR
jgi:hypothetical protein